MGLHGKLVAAVEFKKGGDLFFMTFSQKLHTIFPILPLCRCRVVTCTKVNLEKPVPLSAGNTLTLTVKHLIQAIDDENKSIELKVLEGDILEEYKDVLLKVHVETKGEIDLVTWTLEYETLTDEIGHPTSLLDFFIQTTKEIEVNHR